MAQTQISPEQRQSVLRLKHIFQNNIGIVKDYYQQIKDGNNNPSLDRGMLQEILSSEKDSPSYDDLNRFAKYVAYSSSSAGKAGIRSGYFAELIDKNIDVGKNLLDRKEPHILHREENGITYIEVDPSDIIRNIEIIKKIIATNEVVQEDENE